MKPVTVRPNRLEVLSIPFIIKHKLIRGIEVIPDDKLEEAVQAILRYVAVKLHRTFLPHHYVERIYIRYVKETANIRPTVFIYFEDQFLGVIGLASAISYT